MHVERLVETEALAHGLENFRRGVAARYARRGVRPRRGKEDQEHKHADAEHHKDHLTEALKQGKEHQLRPILIFERGSSASRKPSPRTFNASTVMTMAMPGARATTGRV